MKTCVSALHTVPSSRLVGALLVGGGGDGRLAPALAVRLHLHGEAVLVALAQRAQLHPPPSLAVTENILCLSPVDIKRNSQLVATCIPRPAC